MVADAAFGLVREKGEEALTAREISSVLNCSTQPVLYYFTSIEQIKADVFRRCEEFHSEYITDVTGYTCNPLLAIALRYIRFAREEGNVFRFLTQSKNFEHVGLDGLLDGNDVKPVLNFLRRGAAASEAQAKQIFSSLYLIVHGYASLIANNAVEYDEDRIIRILREAFYGVIYSVKSGVN